MADRQIGNGTLVKVDHDSDTNFTTVACVNQTTPPGQERAEADATCFEDTVEQMLTGIETASEFVFRQVWDPTDTNHLIIDTLYTSKAEVNWQLVLPFATPITMQFSGVVIGKSPEVIENSSVISRNVRIRRKGAITTT